MFLHVFVILHEINEYLENLIELLSFQVFKDHIDRVLGLVDALEPHDVHMVQLPH